MRSATSSTRSVMITRSLCPRSSRACCASCTLIAPSSPQLALLGREHSNCTSCAQRIVDPQLEPLRNSAFGLSVRRMGSSDGKFEVFKSQDGQKRDIIPWSTPNAVIKSDASNKLAIEKQGDRMIFYINDTFVGVEQFEAFFGNHIARIFHKKGQTSSKSLIE